LPNPKPEYIDRCTLVARGPHDCRERDIVHVLSSIHAELLHIFGKNCIMHGLFNTHNTRLSQQDIGTLEQATPDFFADFLRQHPARGNSPRLSAVINYQTRSRVMQAMYGFDQTIDNASISMTMPLTPLPRKHIIALATTISTAITPKALFYHSHTLMHALHEQRPEPPPEPLTLPCGVISFDDDHLTHFDAKWITLDPDQRVPQDLDLPTIERIDQEHGALFVANPKYFHTTERALLKDLIQLHDAIHRT